MPLNLTYNQFQTSEDELRELRKTLYHSTGPGYFIIRNFLTPEQVQHIQSIWLSPDASRHHMAHRGKDYFYLGCPNYYESDARGNKYFYNFLWAPPLDDLTSEITFYVQWIRNRISGRLTCEELFPTRGRSTSYRVVISKSMGREVNFHTDFFHPENPVSREHDLTRLQATLILSDYGKDYESGGFVMRSNAGKELHFGKDVAIQAGDLVIWRYTNVHAMIDVRSRPEQIGFMRILYPLENIYPIGFYRQITDRALKVVPHRVRNMLYDTIPPRLFRKLQKLY